MIAPPESGGRVLVVDDDELLLETLSDILGLQGYEVETAQRGAEALDRVLGTPEPPLVVLLDVGLPDVSGLEIAERINSEDPVTQVVILTGDASLESAIGAVRASSVDYLVKPVEPARLFETIGRASERALRRSAETALERERRRRSEILEASPVGFAVLAADGATEYVNEVGRRLLGFRDGHPDPALVRHVERWLAGLRRRGAGEADAIDEVYRPPGGEERILSCRLRVLRTAEGVEEGALFAFTDVTESRRVEERLRQTQKLEAVGRLAGGVAHDFNNLLTVILAHADLVAADLDEGSEHQADLEAIQEAATQAAEVAGQLLTFSRREPTRLEAVDLNVIVRGLHGLLTRTIGRGITIEVDLDPRLPPVAADAGQLRQVVMNLAVNARDAMERGGGVLTFRTGTRRARDVTSDTLGADPNAVWVWLDVADTGHGMDEETKARIFEPFFTTKLEGKGTGLGLAMVYGIVSQMGGIVDVTSAPDRGTTFRISLPASTRAVRKPAERARSESAVSGRTVLIVDDEDTVRAALRRLLVREGHRVLEASHGREAVEIAQEHPGPIDLLLTDHHMPGLSPAQYVPGVVERHPDIAIVLVTGSTEEGAAALPVGDAPPTILRKPFHADDVRRVLREVLK